VTVRLENDVARASGRLIAQNSTDWIFGKAYPFDGSHC